MSNLKWLSLFKQSESVMKSIEVSMPYQRSFTIAENMMKSVKETMQKHRNQLFALDKAVAESLKPIQSLNETFQKSFNQLCISNITVKPVVDCQDFFISLEKPPIDTGVPIDTGLPIAKNRDKSLSAKIDLLMPRLKESKRFDKGGNS